MNTSCQEVEHIVSDIASLGNLWKPLLGQMSIIEYVTGLINKLLCFLVGH